MKCFICQPISCDAMLYYVMLFSISREFGKLELGCHFAWNTGNIYCCSTWHVTKRSACSGLLAKNGEFLLPKWTILFYQTNYPLCMCRVWQYSIDCWWWYDLPPGSSPFTDQRQLGRHAVLVFYVPLYMVLPETQIWKDFIRGQKLLMPKNFKDKTLPESMKLLKRDERALVSQLLQYEPTERLLSDQIVTKLSVML